MNHDLAQNIHYRNAQSGHKPRSNRRYKIVFMWVVGAHRRLSVSAAALPSCLARV